MKFEIAEFALGIALLADIGIIGQLAAHGHSVPQVLEGIATAAVAGLLAVLNPSRGQ